MNGKKFTYKDAGVDIEEAGSFVERIVPLVRSTYDDRVVGGVGGFAGLYALSSSEDSPLLVAAADGVGTKLRVAIEAGVLDTVGIDLVAMCVNDLVTCGARPLFFLDYLAVGRLDVARCEAVVRGVVEGCRMARCALLGGETAEMPGFYGVDEFDVAGFAVGMVERHGLIDGSRVEEGYKVVGLASSGLHSNGFSLVRKVLFERSAFGLDDRPAELGGATLAEELLKPTRIYVGEINDFFSAFRPAAVAHITGGGLVGNIPRVLPPELGVDLDASSWSLPPVFGLVKRLAGLDWDEMYRTFNCGVGMVVVLPPEEAERLEAAASDPAYARWTDSVIGVIGEVVRVQPGGERVVIRNHP